MMRPESSLRALSFESVFFRRADYYGNQALGLGGNEQRFGV